MNHKFYAHSGPTADRTTWQNLSDHLEATGLRARDTAQAMGLGASAHLAGQYHDFGKYDPAFDAILRGEQVRVGHSTAGAALLRLRATPETKPCAEVLSYAILGHHAGLPDRRGSEASMDRRLDGFVDPVSPQITAAAQPDLVAIVPELIAKMQRGAWQGFDLSVATRMIFSALVDADFKDTEEFYDQFKSQKSDRAWPTLAEVLPKWKERFDAAISDFSADTDINRLRAKILAHVRGNAAMPPGLFTLTVPTGGGKTLASLGFALDHAAVNGHRRIIYAIPYTSIIDQTAEIFRQILGDTVLEHHSSIEEDQPSQRDHERRRLAMEDWAAPLVVTTNVQLFESLFAARPSRARKLHNIAGSVIVLDEAQTLPRPLLLPILRMLDALCKYYGCSIVLCTATQPAFDSAQLGQGGLQLQGRELAPDPKELARKLHRASIVQAGPMDDSALIRDLCQVSQGFVIVNSRKHALDLFRAGQGVDGLIHLTTRQYPAHRRRIIAEIRQRLGSGGPCRLVATSLIEAGVDLDFPTGWRAEAGLDSCVQAAGRVNRNGTRPQPGILTVFQAPDHPAPRQLQALTSAMRKAAEQYDDLLCIEAIRFWFDEVYWKKGNELGADIVDQFRFSPSSGTDFAFRSVAEKFRMVDNAMVPVIIADEPNAHAAVERLGYADIPSGTLARALQQHTVQIPQKARSLLIANGHAAFRHPALRGDQFCVLNTQSLYQPETGLHWENADYLSVEDTFF